jgi:EAL domain-containing protein (putative c-di-GMP-specific phosphodiesterase class I)
MREALGAGHFQLHYQPKLDLRSGCVTGAEALIRWQHPQKGMVPPGRFIPFAEETGFIREITPWALRQAATDAANWKREGRDIVIAVNLSARDLLNRQLVPGIRQLLAEFALPAQSLCLEITESALMDDPALALAHLNELAALGLKLAIDDYGTGQASLAYVKTLPVHELKIDRSFVPGCGRGATQRCHPALDPADVSRARADGGGRGRRNRGRAGLATRQRLRYRARLRRRAPHADRRLSRLGRQALGGGVRPACVALPQGDRCPASRQPCHGHATKTLRDLESAGGRGHRTKVEPQIVAGGNGFPAARVLAEMHEFLDQAGKVKLQLDKQRRAAPRQGRSGGSCPLALLNRAVTCKFHLSPPTKQHVK